MDREASLEYVIPIGENNLEGHKVEVDGFSHFRDN